LLDADASGSAERAWRLRDPPSLVRAGARSPGAGADGRRDPATAGRLMTAVKALTSHDNPLLVRLRKLAADPGGYRKLGEIWLEGDHLCSAFLQCGGAATHAVITEAAWQEPRWQELAGRAATVAVVPQALMAG